MDPQYYANKTINKEMENHIKPPFESRVCIYIHASVWNFRGGPKIQCTSIALARHASVSE